MFFIFLSVFSHSTNVSIKTITVNEQPAYEIQIDGFAHESNALQFKFKISSSIDKPILIEHATDNNYSVKIGPFSDYAAAQKIHDQLRNESSAPVNLPRSNDEDTQSMEETAIPPSDKKLWNLKNADIRAVIAEVSRVTGKNFVIDPRVQGQISIVSSTPMSNNELYQVFLSVLQVAGYAAIPNGQIIKIVPNIDAHTQAPDLLSQLKKPPQGDEMMVEVVPIHYVPAEQLIPALRPLLPQWSSISAYGPSNMLILSGRANTIRQLSQIIKQVDTSSVNNIDIVPLKHALAMDVANTLKDLVKTQPGNNMQQMTLAPDDRSNSILLSGSRTERIKLRLLIAKLDQESAHSGNSNTQVVYLNYLRAEDLVPILAGIAKANFSGAVGTTIGSITRPPLDSTSPASNVVNYPSNSEASSTASVSTGTLANPEATPNTETASTQSTGSTKPTVQIIAEPNTNSIIINAPVTLIRILKTVITQLDIRPAQILIEALVAEVDENDVNSLGIEWGSNLQTGKPTDFRPGFAIINSATSIDDFQAQIYALASQRKANILSTPSVVVLDNRQAKILVGKQVSVASTTYPNNAGGTTTASPYVTYDRVNVALHLYVRPQITRGEGIQLQIDQGNDTLDPASTAGTNNPIFKISSIVTSVHVESGNIVVLGGLAQDSLGTDNNHIPILGDIPGLGRFFRRDSTNREKRVLMVFIRPIILRTPNDAIQVTGSKYTNIRQYQLEWLHTQQFNRTNENIVLPHLNPQPLLPVPFSHPKPSLATK